jgi:hypothetical protein
MPRASARQADAPASAIGVGEATGAPTEVAEAALAHVLGSKTEAAYARGDLFEKRRKLMDEWGTFCARPPSAGGVVAAFRPRDTVDATKGAI